MKAMKRLLPLLLIAVMLCFALAGCLDSKIKVTYMVGEEEYLVQEYEMNAQIELPEAPKAEGKNFVGWYTDKELTTPYTTGEVNYAMTLYAKFNTASVVISVNPNGGTINGSDKNHIVNVVPGASYTLPTPVKEGYTFKGFVGLDGTPFAATGTFSGNQSIGIIAQYEINKYTVSFMDGNTAAADAATVEYGSKASAPQVSKAGYTLEGWYTAAGDKFDFNTPITENTVLSANYVANTYTVTLNLNGGALEAGASTNVSVTYGAAYTLPVPTKAGFTFTGYTVDGTAFASNGTYNRVGNVVLVANWANKFYTVTFKDFGTDAVISTVENVAHNAKVTIPAAVAGYEIAGAYKQDKTTAFNAAADTITDNITVYVKYQPKTFTITVTNAGQGYVNPQVQFGATYTLTTPDRGTGYTFIGFVKDGQPFAVTGTYTWTENITVEAIWEGEGRDISFYNGNQYIDTVESLYGADISTITLIPVPTIPGFENDGKWYTDIACTTEFVAEGILENNIKLYAKYTAKRFEITVINGNDVTTVPVIYGQTYSLPTNLTKTGYTFGGYALLNNDEFASSGTYEIDGNTTVKVVWNEDNITVNFYVDGVATPVEILRGLTVSAIADPSKVGHNFDGWYIDQALTTKFNFSTAITEDNFILYAGFSPAEYTLTFRVWDATLKAMKEVSVTVQYGGYISVPARADRPRYNFLGYFVDGVEFDVNAIFDKTEGFTIEEKWEADSALFEYIESENYFRERENPDDEWTVVLRNNVPTPYTFNGYTLELVNALEHSRYATISENTIMPILPGTIQVRITPADGSESYVRNIKIVENVVSLGAGADYNAAWSDAARNTSTWKDIWQNEAKGDKMDVGLNNFIPEVAIKGAKGDLDIDSADIIIEVYVDGDLTDKWTRNASSISFAQELKDKEVTVKVYPKYVPSVAPNTATFAIKLNDGVNVYNDAELKASYADSGVKVINILRDIEAVLSEGQYATKYTDANGMLNGYNYGVANKPITSPITSYEYDPLGGAGGVYARKTGDLQLNGNYFSVTTDKIPLIDNNVDPLRNKHVDNIGGAIQNNHFSVFLFGVREDTTNNSTISIENINIVGNLEGLSMDKAPYKINGSKDLYVNSGAIIGIQIGSGNMNLDNVTARRGAFSMNAYAKTVKTLGDGTQTNNVNVYAKDCNFSNSWSNNIYTIGFPVITLDNCYIGLANGSALHHDVRSNPNGVETEVNFVNGTVIDNWVTGEEAWFTIYGVAFVMPSFKSGVNMAVEGYSGGTQTILKGDTSDTRVNFAIIAQQTGDDWPSDTGTNRAKLNVSTFGVTLEGQCTGTPLTSAFTETPYGELSAYAVITSK